MRWGGLLGLGSVVEYFLLSILEFLQFGVWGLEGVFLFLLLFWLFGKRGQIDSHVWCLSFLSVSFDWGGDDRGGQGWVGSSEGTEGQLKAFFIAGWTVLLIYTCLLGLLDRYERLCRDERRVREMVYA